MGFKALPTGYGSSHWAWGAAHPHLRRLGAAHGREAFAALGKTLARHHLELKAGGQIHNLLLRRLELLLVLRQLSGFHDEPAAESAQRLVCIWGHDVYPKGLCI